MTLDELKTWLIERNFKVGNNPLRGQFNDCDWYAYRRTKIKARECETNGDRCQIVLTPHSYTHDGVLSEQVTIDVTGERKGIWWKLQAYALRPHEVRDDLDVIEISLVSAWNCLP